MAHKKQKKHDKKHSKKSRDSASKEPAYLIPTLILGGFGLIAGAVYLAFSSKNQLPEQADPEEMLTVSDDHPEDADLEDVIDNYGTDREEDGSEDYVDAH